MVIIIVLVIVTNFKNNNQMKNNTLKVVFIYVKSVKEKKYFGLILMNL